MDGAKLGYELINISKDINPFNYQFRRIYFNSNQNFSIQKYRVTSSKVSGNV